MTEGIRILIADDQPRARQSLKALLRTWPVIKTIREATNGQEALALIEESPPDVVLMGIRLPEMPARAHSASVDGLEATRRIKARWPEVQVIVLSVYNEHMTDALAAGASAFVCKCEPPKVLLKTLEQVMSQLHPPAE